MAVVARFGINAVFYAVGVSSAMADASVLLIRENDLDEKIATGLTSDGQRPVKWNSLLRDRTILFLFVAISLFHFANAPVLPAVALYVKQLGGSDQLMTATVLTAQCVMVPVALFAGRFCDRWGRKPVLAIAFWALPLRILSYTFVASAPAIVWLQTLDGIGAGIYGMAVVAVAADLTRGKGWFNTLTGLFASAVAVGGFIGPLLTGILLQHLGFKATFYCFAVLATVGAGVFTLLVRETRARDEDETVESQEAA
jgi:MFS family permease